MLINTLEDYVRAQDDAEALLPQALPTAVLLALVQVLEEYREGELTTSGQLRVDRLLVSWLIRLQSHVSQSGEQLLPFHYSDWSTEQWEQFRALIGALDLAVTHEVVRRLIGSERIAIEFATLCGPRVLPATRTLFSLKLG